MKNIMDFLNKNLVKLFFALVVGFTFLFGVLIIKAPAVEKNPTSDQFNAQIAVEHIYNISKEPHSVLPEDEVAHAAVRKYLVDTATEYTDGNPNATVEVKNYQPGVHTSITNDGTKEEQLPYEIDNVLVQLKGKSDTGILIMAHYDSRGHIGREGELGGSYGATDDGYGLATMLEVLRIFGKKADLENSIYFLFTDGEETGLYGAELEMKYNKPLMSNVNFVLNIEARGSTGAAYMFETGSNNFKSMQFYNTTQDKITYSLATAVYQVMPNYTDFTPFVREGYAGFNFCALDTFEVYHTPDDNYNVVNAATLGHYTNQILPLVQEYTYDTKYSDADYFESTGNAIAFNIMPGTIVVYDIVVGIILLVLAIATFAVIVWLRNKEGKSSIKKLLCLAGKVFLAMLGCFAVGFAVANILAAVYSVNFSLTYTRIAGLNSVFFLSMIAMAVLAVVALRKKSSEQRKDLSLAATFINLVLATLTTFTLPGASFLFLVPALAVAVVALASHFIRNRFEKMPEALSVFINVIFFVPLTYSLFIALTVGALGVVMLLAVMPMITTVSTLMDVFCKKEITQVA